MLDLELWRQYVADLNCEPLFVTVSGAHLYGFESPDSDVDLRGAHRLPLEQVVGLAVGEETFERSGIHAGIEVDLVCHDVGKYFRLLVRNNGYVLEQIFSPLVVVGQDLLDRLRPVAARCITRHHYHHYKGFYFTQRKLLEKSDPPTVKSALYAYRVLLTGIHLLETGEVEAHLPRLNERFSLPGIDDLIAAKVTEQADLPVDLAAHLSRLDGLAERLEAAHAQSRLPADRDTAAVNDLLVELRLAGLRAEK